MANLQDYLKWRGDLPFSVDPFHEVDNLILSLISYVDFDGLVSESGVERFSLKEIADKYFAIHTEEELKARKTFIRFAPFIFQEAAATNRFGSLLISDYVNLVEEKSEIQLSAVTFWLPDGTAYVAFRGTDDTLIGWKEDFNLSFMAETEGQRLAVNYLNCHFAGTATPLRVGGHSKGGNLAVYASAFASPAVQDYIQVIYSNDGPGLKEELTLTEGYRKILPRIISTVPEDSIVGLLLSSEAQNHVVKSSASGIAQHDATTWEVLGNRFVEAKERSAFSQYFEKTLRKWIGGLGDEERATFTESLFELLSAGGASTLTDIKNNRTFLVDVLKKAASMPKGEWQEFQGMLTKLFQIGTDMVKEEIAGSSIGKKLPLPKNVSGSDAANNGQVCDEVPVL